MKPTRSFQQRLTFDSCIFAAIVLVTMLLMNIRHHDRLVERSRGIILYTPAVPRHAAHRLGDQLQAKGIFTGTPGSVRLDQSEGVHDIRIAVDAEKLQAGNTQQLLENVMREICREVFGAEPAIVRLSDEAFRQHTILLVHP